MRTFATPRFLQIPGVAFLLLTAVSVPGLAAHPSLFFSSADVASLRTKAQGTHQAIATPLIQGASGYLGTHVARDGNVSWSTGAAASLGDLRDIGNSLVVFAFVSQISTDSRYQQLAHDWLMDICTFNTFDLDGTHDLVQGHLLWAASIAYDLLAPSLSSAEIRTVRNALTQNANEMVTAAQGGVFWKAEFEQNHNWINHGAVGIAALATMGDLPAGTTGPWLSFALANATNVKMVMDGIGDGTWHEGLGYQSYGLDWHLAFVTALKRLTGTDLSDLGMVRGLGAGRAHMQLPENPSGYILSNGDFFGFSRDDGLAPLRYAASKYQDGVAQATADRWIKGTTPSTYAPELSQRMFEFLFYDPAVPSADLHAQPLDWFGADLQIAVFRSGWDPGATLFALKNGPYAGSSNWLRTKTGSAPVGDTNWGHDHADDNGFYLYGNGSWLAPEAAGYFIGHPDSPGPQANQTVYHNSLTIDGSGQLGEGVRTRGDDASGYAWFPTRRAGITQFGSAHDFSYALGDGSQLYGSGLGLTRWDRHALFIDRKWIVLRDVIQATTAHDYHWVSHFMNGAAQEGRWIHGVGEQGQALGVAVVAPALFSAFLGQQAPVNIWDLNPAGSVSLLTIAPVTAARNVTFLTALIPSSEAAWAARPLVTALDATHPEVGLSIVDKAHTVSVVFNEPGAGSRTVAGLSLAGQTGVVEYNSGAVSRILLVEGTELSNGHPLVTQTAPTQMFEADGLDGLAVVLSGTGISDGRIYAPHATTVTWNGNAVAFTRAGDEIIVGAQPPTTDGGFVADAGPSSDDGGLTTGIGSPLIAPSLTAPVIGRCGCTTFEGTGSVALGILVVVARLRRRRV